MNREARSVLRWLLTGASCLALLTLMAPHSRSARGERLALHHVVLDLSGPPARVIPADLNGDGRTDLAIVVVYTEIEEVGDDRIEELVQISTVIPMLFDRRELHLYLADENGDYVEAGPPLELPTSVLHLEPGPPGTGIVALTDDGLSRLRLGDDPDSPALRLEPLLRDPPVLARTGSFYPNLRLVHDLDGDRIADVFIPAHDALAIYLGTGTGLESVARARVPIPDRVVNHGVVSTRWYPLPTVREIDGDGKPDLLFKRGIGGEAFRGAHVFLGTGGGRFGAIRDEPIDCHDRLTDLRFAPDGADSSPWPRDLTDLRDVDGDGRAEAVISIDRSRGQSFRKELKDAKRPLQTFRFHRLRDDVSVEREPYFETQVVGHTIEGNPEDFGLLSGVEQFADLDGDGREDLVTLTLDFSIFQALKILTTKKIGIGIDFHVYAHGMDGKFREVSGLDLSEKLKFDLNDLKLGRFAQFAGDFNGDGRQDFVHLGRGRMVTLHAGRPGCRYPKKPDLSIELEEEPASLDLIYIEDLDGDGRSDLRITRPLPATDVDATAPVRLDLYLSGAGR